MLTTAKEEMMGYAEDSVNVQMDTYALKQIWVQIMGSARLIIYFGECSIIIML